MKERSGQSNGAAQCLGSEIRLEGKSDDKDLGRLKAALEFIVLKKEFRGNIRKQWDGDSTIPLSFCFKDFLLPTPKEEQTGWRTMKAKNISK